MNYRIKRGDQEFGPYSLADLQNYVQTGNVLATDMAQSEGMSDWIPVSQVLGDIPTPSSIAPSMEAVQPAVPLPLNIPWWLLLVAWLSNLPHPIFKLLALIPIIASFMQAGWARKLNGKNTALVLVSMYIVGVVTGGLFAGIAVAMHMPALAGFGGLPILAGLICNIVAAFKIRDAMEEYYNSVENIGLSMSGAMTFFFNIIYIQFHINRIARMKQSGEIS